MRKPVEIHGKKDHIPATMTVNGVPFRKMNGLGNDFVVLDLRTHALNLSKSLVRAIADRETGIGCDQFITIENARHGGDVFMGIETLGGDLIATAGADALITVDMGEPRLKWNEIPLSEEFQDTRAIELEVGPLGAPLMHSPAVVNVGNPHAIFFVNDIDAIDLGRIGPMLENHPLFPERANISVAQVIDRSHIQIKVWERGAGLTLACGTAACATVVAAVRRRKSERNITVSLPGGDLQMEWRESDNHIYMTGPSTLDYEGTLDQRFFNGELA